MKIFKSEQIRKIDAYTIKHEPVESIDLMERAAKELFKWVKARFDVKTGFVFFVGPGNNGGDGWALARMLYYQGFTNLSLYLLKITDTLSPDSEINKARLMNETDISIEEIKKEEDFPYIAENEWIVDGLFGSGMSRPLSGLSATLVNYINTTKKQGVISIDMPSGLLSEDNEQHEGIKVKATFTLSFQFPKLSFFFAENNTCVGKWEVLPIGLHPDIVENEQTSNYYIGSKDVLERMKFRDKFSHKGTYGHALIIAGSYGMMGAAVLATRAAVKSGAGLVTAHVPHLGYEIIQTTVPEAIVSLDESDLMFTGVKHVEYSAIAVGPGINIKPNTCKALQDLISVVEVPLVIDADGLNILSKNKEWYAKLPPNTILTPHPREFDRLTSPHETHYQRFLEQIEFSRKYNLIVVLKGAHTSISLPNGKVWFNTNGNPGMAKGGSGDVLTGIIVALLAQGYHPSDAAIIAVYIHGLSGDMALKSEGYHALTPSDIILRLGTAFMSVELSV